jgi:hypothetical protein
MDSTLKPLKTTLEAIRDMASNALRQIAEWQENLARNLRRDSPCQRDQNSSLTCTGATACWPFAREQNSYKGSSIIVAIELPPFAAAHCCQIFNLLVFFQLTSQLTRVHCITGRPETIACSRKNLSQRSDRVHAEIYGN